MKSKWCLQVFISKNTMERGKQMEKQNGEEIYRKVGTLLEEREKLYQEREQNLSAFREELKEMEQSLGRRKHELKETERELEEAKKGLEAEKERLCAERAAVREEWQQLDRKKQEVEQDMERVLKEEAKLQGMKNEWLKMENETELFEMEQVKAGMEFENGESGQEEGSGMPGLVMQEAGRPEETIALLEPGADMDGKADVVEKIPQALKGIAMEAAKSFPEGKDAESTQESFYIRIRDKELRFCMGQPLMAEIRTRREKSRFLLNGIKQFNRQQSEWEFAYEDGYLKCTMPFTEAVRPETVVRKCKEAMGRFFVG